MPNTRLCIVRHGETDWNAARRIQGHVDIPLNVVGHSQAAATAHGIVGEKFAAIYSSDLIRTMQTANTLAGIAGVQVQAEPGLRERHFGRMQGMTYEEIQAQDVVEAARFRQRDPYYDFGGGETLIAFADRIHATVERLATTHPGQTLLLVTHGGVLDIIHRRISGRGLSAPRDFTVPNAALNWIEIDPKGWRLLSWADRKHLEVAIEQSVE
jgi:2,3-bisphosphoglycerate-dependent phosphoglycerate mutase